MYLVVILIIGIISFIAFSNTDLQYKLQFNAYQIIHRRQYYRMFSHAFVHSGWGHLLLNLFVLYSFGRGVTYQFAGYLGINGDLLFLILFISAIPISSLYSLSKEKNNPHYNAVGASGAVMAVVFASIFLEPYSMIYLYFIPIPGIVFGVLFLIYTKYMSYRGNDNIGHDAHFWGAVYGFFFPAIFNPELLQLFIHKIISF